MYNYSPCGISALEKTTRLEWQQWSRVPLRSHEGSLLSREAGGLFQCRTTARVVIILSPVNIACPLPPCNTRSRFLGCLRNRSTIPKKSWRIYFGNPGSKSIMHSKNRKSYLENRKSYELLNAIFDFRQFGTWHFKKERQGNYNQWEIRKRLLIQRIM